MTRLDLNNYGYNPKSVEVSTDLNHINEVMKAEYLEKAKEYGVSEEDALDDYFSQRPMSVDCQFYEDNYAYISSDYYWDIFVADV